MKIHSGVNESKRQEPWESGNAKRVWRSCRGRRSLQLLSLLLCVVSAVLAGCHPGQRVRPSTVPLVEPIRALWVTRWDYKSAADIAAVMENCRVAGFNTVLFQVRGNGTAFYESRFEPWAEELGGRNPGFDPLETACREGKRRGLRVHAWVNVMPAWRGKKPPTHRGQLYWTHPDWFLRDAQDRRQPLGWYNSLNPCYPEVRAYLVAVMHEIVTRYPVDGLHLDYIRFPNEWNNSYPPGAKVPDYPRDRRTLALFRRATGQTPESSPGSWIQWRTEQVTELVRDIRTMMRKTAPRALFSAAVGPSPGDAHRRHFQDARQWIREGLLDAVYPMNYTADAQKFNQRRSNWARIAAGQEGVRRIPVVMGIMCDQRASATVISQINTLQRQAGQAHFAAFAYNAFFERRDEMGRNQTNKQSPARKALRRAVIPYLRRLAQQQRDAR